MIRFEDISVAPMEGFTTFPMRLFLFMTSAPQKMTTPFLKVTRTYPDRDLPYDFVPELMELRDVFPYELIPQYIAGEIDCFLRAAELIPESLSRVIDFNCGCPSPNSMGKFAGSGILQDPLYFHESVARIVESLGESRVSIKMRVGIARENEFFDLLDQMEGFTFHRLTIHGRTKKAGYRGMANWALVEEAARRFASRTPVYGSGDVDSASRFRSFELGAPSATGLMIGRGVLKNPWVFEEIRQDKDVAISGECCVLALYCYLLIQDLWQREPFKLMARIAKGRIGGFCGVSAKAWEHEAVELSTLALGLPILPFGDREIAVDPVAFDRLKILWSYLRSSLPISITLSGVNKSRNPREFFRYLNDAVIGRDEGLTLGIQRESV